MTDHFHTISRIAKTFLLCIMPISGMAATTATVTTAPVFDLYQGSALISPRVTKPTFAECMDAATILGKGDGCQSRNGKFKLTVVADPPAVTWSRASGEGEQFTLITAAQVRYGAGTVWTAPKSVPAGQVDCSNNTFGDPIYGTLKECQVSPASALQPTATQPPPLPVTSTPPAGTGTVELIWSAPLKNTDGTEPADFVGYRLCHGSSQKACSDAISLPATSTRFTFTGLTSGQHYFALTAYNSEGIESAFSAIASATIP